MKKHLHFESKEASEFYAEIKRLSESKPVWSVWADWVEAAALVISIASEFRPEVRSARAERYKELLAKYRLEEVKAFDRMLDCVINALENRPEQDFLGKMFEELDLSDHWKAQFFTPYDVSELMARINLANVESVLAHREWTDILDTCSGAGVLLIASRNYLKSRGIGYDRVLFVGQDIDKVAGLMGYIQLSLLGCAGYIVIGNSLTNPVHGLNDSKLLPKDDSGYELWFMPMFRSFVWEYRRAKELLKLQTNYNNDKDDS